MEKLRIGKKGLYEIEVNDKGETIVFDTQDIELPFKLNDAYIKIDEALKNLKAKEVIIKKKKGKKYGVISSVDEELRQLYKSAFATMREAMDCFLGEGACQKIFGDRNYLDMYDDLFAELEPHFVKMGIGVDKSLEKIEKKYAEENNGSTI